MAFFEDLGNGLNSILDSVTGKTRQDNYSKSLDIQKDIANAALAAQAEENRLKYNPELAKQRTKQIAFIAVPIIIVTGVILYLKFK